MECNVKNLKFNLMDSFVRISLNTKNEILNLQGLFFRDFENFGLIVPKIHIDEKEFRTVTIISPTCDMEFEFKCSLSNIDDDYLSYIPLIELGVNGKNLIHINRAYSQEQLSVLRYCTKQNFSQPLAQNDSYFGTYLEGLSKQVMRSSAHEIIKPLREEYSLDADFMYISIPDVFLYHGSPFIVETTIQEDKQLIDIQSIKGILTANIEIKSIKTNKLNNLGMLITLKSIQDFFKKF